MAMDKIITPERIGEVAGRMWKQLRAHGPASFNAITRSIGFSEPEVYMAIGWLCREGKLACDTTTGNYGLVEREMAIKV